MSGMRVTHEALLHDVPVLDSPMPSTFIGTTRWHILRSIFVKLVIPRGSPTIRRRGGGVLVDMVAGLSWLECETLKTGRSGEGRRAQTSTQMRDQKKYRRNIARASLPMRQQRDLAPVATGTKNPTAPCSYAQSQE